MAATVYAGSAIFFFIAVLCARRGAKNWRQFRCGRKRPLLTEVTPDQLTAIRIEWPLVEKRWPPPWADDSRAMEPELAAAYGRLAARARRTSSVIAEVLFIVGGAWLGVSLPDIWNDYRESSADATRALQADQAVFLGDITWQQFAHLMPAILVALGVALTVLMRAYEEAEQVYSEAARPDAPEVSRAPLRPPAGSRKGLVPLVRRLLRGM
jgi:hypothetical protein